jgi:hypothetical protein
MLAVLAKGCVCVCVCVCIYIYFFYWNCGRWSPYWVHAALRPCIGLLYLSRVIVRVEKLVELNVVGRGNRSTRRKPAPVPFCPPQIPLARTGREPGPPWWEASDKPLQLWCGLRVCIHVRGMYKDYR